MTTGLGLGASTGAQGSASASDASPKSATAATTGLSLGSMAGGSSSPPSGSSSPPSGASGLVFGSDAANSGAKSSTGSPDMSMFKSRIPDRPSKTIEVPFEIVVVCEPEGLVIHPGGYRISGAVLESRKKDGILVRELLGVAQQRAAADPTIRPQPRVKFLVESGGSPMFWAGASRFCSPAWAGPCHFR